ncbi:class I SAM-dependent methyltransferase [Pectobacterium parvum]|uniref:Methyltransferase n=1 Tax=Pectobacterium parvum TaxID=2778550 RepID=A0ABW8FUN8_9GAMM
MSNPISDTTIDFYKKHAHKWDEIRQKNFREKSWMERFLSETSSNGNILDIGCGSGNPLGGYMINKGYNVRYGFIKMSLAKLGKLISL